METDIENYSLANDSTDKKTSRNILSQKNSYERLDHIDLKILRILQKEARLTVKEVAARVHLSTTPVFERWKRLESDGFIKRYVAILDAEKVHRGFIVFCNVKMRLLSFDVVKDFMDAIKDIPEVAECYRMSGQYDFLLKVHSPDMTYYKNFVMEILGRQGSIGTIESWFVMDEIKHTYEVLPPENGSRF